MKTQTEKQLSRLERAYNVQNLVNPILKKGGIPKSEIYLNVVLKKSAMCRNTFWNLMKLKEAQDYPMLLKEYREEQRAKYQARLERQREKRIKA